MIDVRKTASLILASFALVACGAGSKNHPMVADPGAAPAEDAAPSSDTFAGATDNDASAPSAALPADPTAPADAAGAPVTTDPPATAAAPQGGEEGARTFLGQFVAPNADHLALTRSLRPTSADYKALFDAKAASKIEAGQAKEWGSNKAVIKPKPAQTEVKLWSATGADLAKGAASAKEFPAGYKKVGKHLAPAVTFFRFKFVEPGKETGTAYDGLAFVNGHWVIAPKPWRAFEGKAGEEESETPAAATPAKPKPKGKGKGKKH